MSAINSLPSSGTSSDKRTYEPSMEEILASIRRIIADDQSIPGRGGASVGPASAGEASPGLLRMPAASQPTASVRADENPEPSSSADREPAASEPPAALREVPSPVMPDDLPEEVPAPLLPHELRAHGPVSAPQYPTPDGRIGATDEREMRVASEPFAAQPLPEPLPHALAVSRLKVEAEQPIPRAAPAPAPEDTDMFDVPIEPRAAPEPAPLFSAATDSSVTSAFNMLAASRLADNSDELINLVREMIRPMLRAWLDDNLPSMVERLVRAEIERVARGGR